jgi:hypothetical protein
MHQNDVLRLAYEQTQRHGCNIYAKAQSLTCFLNIQTLVSANYPNLEMVQ